MEGSANIALIGFRASGKSLIGRLLARRHHLTFVDMDERLVALSGKEIDQWVAAEGWESFRQAESELLDDLARGEGLVVATGGGVVLSAHNRRVLKTHFHVIWLQASLETTCLRMMSDPNTGRNRPALTALPLRQEIEQLLAARSRLYEETAHVIVETDNISPTELVSLLQCRLWHDRKPTGGADAHFPTD